MSYSSQMSPDYKNSRPGGAGPQYQVARTPPQGAGQYRHFQNMPQQEGSGGYQQSTGSTQGRAIVSDPYNRPAKSSSGPISSEPMVEDQAGGLWMSEHQQPTVTKRPNSARLYQVNQSPGQGKYTSSSLLMYTENAYTWCIILLCV